MSNLATKNLRTIRGWFGWGQERFGEVLGLPYKVISNYETGRNEIPIDLLTKLSNMLNLSINTLIDVELPDIKFMLEEPIQLSNLKHIDICPYCLDEYETKNNSYNRALATLCYLDTTNKIKLTSDMLIDCYNFSCEALEELCNEASAMNCLSFLFRLIYMFPYYDVDYGANPPIFWKRALTMYFKSKCNEKGTSSFVKSFTFNNREIITLCINILKNSKDKNYRELSDYYTLLFYLIEGINSPSAIEHATSLLLHLAANGNPYAINYLKTCAKIFNLQCGESDMSQIIDILCTKC